MDYYSAIKKSEILPFMTAWMDLKGVMLSEISQTKTNIIWFHLYIDSKEQKNKQNRNKLVDTEKRQIVARREVLRGWVKKVRGLGWTNWYLQNSQMDVKYNIRTVVNNIVVTIYGARWVI